MDSLAPPPFPHPPTTAAAANHRYLDSWHFDPNDCNKIPPPGIHFSRRPPPDLLDNCDLPPPLKVFFSPKEVAFGFGGGVGDERTMISMTNYLPNLVVGQCLRNEACRLEPNNVHRALRLSQTRAREAERKAALASERSEQMARLLLEESARLSAHRRWVMLLEIETRMLEEEKRMRLAKQEGKDEVAAAPETCWLALALCLGSLGIAGVGFVLRAACFDPFYRSRNGGY